MAQYKIDSGLANTTNDSDFKTDKAAWNKLRKHLPHRYATLYKRVDVSIPILNKDVYILKFESKYKYLPGPTSYWLPIFHGLTDDPYTEYTTPELQTIEIAS